MALDEALDDRARRRPASGCLRVYSWSAPTISLGRNQSARGRYDLDRIRAARLARRPAADRRPRDSPPSGNHLQRHGAGRRRRRSARVVRAHQPPAPSRRSQRLGVRRGSSRTPASARRAPGPAPCFDEPSAGELTRRRDVSWPEARSGEPTGRCCSTARSSSTTIRVDSPTLTLGPSDRSSRARRRSPTRWAARRRVARCCRRLGGRRARARRSRRCTPLTRRRSCVPEPRPSSSVT